MRVNDLSLERAGAAKRIILEALESSSELRHMTFLELSIAIGQVFNEVCKTNVLNNLARGQDVFGPDVSGRASS